MNVTPDKYGNLFGFITHKPENMYFNELDNPDLNISYEGKRVTYRITTAGGGERAINVKAALREKQNSKKHKILPIKFNIGIWSNT